MQPSIYANHQICMEERPSSSGHHFMSPRRMGSFLAASVCLVSVWRSLPFWGLALSIREYLKTKTPILLPKNWYDYSPGMAEYRSCDPEMKWPKHGATMLGRAP